MARQTQPLLSRRPSTTARRVATAMLAFAGVAAMAAPARAEAPDNEAVVSALQTTTQGSTQITGYGDAPLDEPARLLGGSVVGVLPLFEEVSLEVAGLGYHQASAGPDAPGATGVGLMAGLRVSIPAERVRPYATARVAHIFHASDDHWRRNPLRNITGTTEEGLRHPVGAALGVGVETPIGGGSSPFRPVLDVGVRVVDRPAEDGEVVVNCQLRFPGLALDLL